MKSLQKKLIISLILILVLITTGCPTTSTRGPSKDLVRDYVKRETIVVDENQSRQAQLGLEKIKPGVVRGIEFCNTNKFLISYGLSGAVTIHTIRGKPVRIINDGLPNESDILSADISKNCDLIVAATANGEIAVFDVDTGNLISKNNVNGSVTAIRFLDKKKPGGHSLHESTDEIIAAGVTNKNRTLLFGFLWKNSDEILPSWRTVIKQDGFANPIDKIETAYANLEEFRSSIIGDLISSDRLHEVDVTGNLDNPKIFHSQLWIEEVKGKMYSLTRSMNGFSQLKTIGMYPYYQPGYGYAKMGRAILPDRFAAMGSNIFADSPGVDIYEIDGERFDKLKTLRTTPDTAKTALTFSIDGKYLAGGDRYGVITVWDTNKFYKNNGSTKQTPNISDTYLQKNNSELQYQSTGFTSYSLNNSGNLFAIGAGKTAQFGNVSGYPIIVFNLVTKDIKYFINKNVNNRITFSYDNKYLLSLKTQFNSAEDGIESVIERGIAMLSGSISQEQLADKTLIDLSTMEVVQRFEGGKEPTGRYSDIVKSIMNINKDGRNFFWDGAREQISKSFNGVRFELETLENSGTIFTNNGDKLTISMFAEGFVIATEDGYFDYFGNVLKYIGFYAKNNDYIDLNRLYGVFYRPDIVLETLKGVRQSMGEISISDALNNPPPHVEIEVKKVNERVANTIFKITSSTSSGGIGDIQLYQNGKLIKKIFPNNQKLVSGTVSLDLVSGDNTISILAYNKTGTMHSVIRNETVKSKHKITGRLNILAIGINEFRLKNRPDDGFPLVYAVKDSIEFTDVLKKLWKKNNKQLGQVTLLHDAEASKKAIINAIIAMSASMTPDDTFIFYVASHGTLLKNGYNILTHDYDGMGNSNSFITSNEIIDVMMNAPALKQAMIFDTCFSGSVNDIMQKYFTSRISKLGKNTGIHIFAAASATKRALDGYNGNGLFTYSVLKALKDNSKVDRNKNGSIDIAEIGWYAGTMTQTITNTIAGFSQKPSITNFGHNFDVYALGN